MSVVPAGGTVRPSNDGAQPRAAQGAALTVEASLLRWSVKLVEERRAEAIGFFYAHLFGRHPDLRAIFPITEVEDHDRLLGALLHVMKNAHLLHAMADDLAQVGRDHRKFDVAAAHYAAVGDSLIATASAMLGEDWTAELAHAWRIAYDQAAEIMFRAASAVPRESRRWWTAEVVKHERRTWDVAVIEVQPAEPYNYLPGQYTTIETPHWPRLWRPYSIANAPRIDGTLEFHIRQVEGGQGGWALVDAVHVGHVLKLGPPAGTLVLDHTRPRDLLLVAGGTGLAPMRALVEDVVAHGGGRRVCLFVGARTEEDLYDLDALAELHRENKWLAIVPVVSEDPGYDGHRGLVVDAVAQYGPWTEFESYICGPPEMVEATRKRLREIGIPARQIHHEIWQADIDELAVSAGAELVRYAGPSTVLYGRRQSEAAAAGSVRNSAQQPTQQPTQQSDAELRAQQIREMIELKRARRSMYSKRR